MIGMQTGPWGRESTTRTYNNENVRSRSATNVVQENLWGYPWCTSWDVVGDQVCVQDIVASLRGSYLVIYREACSLDAIHA